MVKRLIINCDDFGQSIPANTAIMHLLKEGKVSSATIMPPAPEFRSAIEWIKRGNMTNIGLHLTLTSEWAGYRWPSLTGRASLHDETGNMYQTVREFEKEAEPQDVRAEIRAQFQAMKEARIDYSHVDNHMGSLYGIETGRSYLPYVLWQCSRHGLPFRLPRKIYEKDEFLNSIPGADQILAKVVALADTLGVGLPDYLLSHSYQIEEGENYDSFKKMLITKLYNLPDGISETYIHPGIDDAFMKKHIPSWEKRVWEYRLMLDEDFEYALKDANVILTDYRYIREIYKPSKLKSAFSLLKQLRG